jgi:hypothetical protein
MLYKRTSRLLKVLLLYLTYRNFYFGFIFKAAIAVLFGLIKPTKNMIPNLIGLFSNDTFSFCLFLGKIFYDFLCKNKFIFNLRVNFDKFFRMIIRYIQVLTLISSENSEPRRWPEPINFRTNFWLINFIRKFY